MLCCCGAAEQVKPNQPHKDLPKDAGEHTIQRLDQMRNSKGNLHTAEIRRNMQRIMQVSFVGSFRATTWLSLLLFHRLHCKSLAASQLLRSGAT